jgi:hypothetical protein
MHTLTVGQIVIVKSNGNYNKEYGLKTAVISKVGKKYFELEGNEWWSCRFFIETLVHDGKGYSSCHKVYLSQQDIDDEEEQRKLSIEIGKNFNYGSRISLNKLRKIKEILDSTEG